MKLIRSFVNSQAFPPILLAGLMTVASQYPNSFRQESIAQAGTAAADGDVISYSSAHWIEGDEEAEKALASSEIRVGSSLEIAVSNDLGDPLKDAEVSISFESKGREETMRKQTSANGIVNFTVPVAERVGVKVRITAPGYSKKEEIILLEQYKFQNISLKQASEPAQRGLAAEAPGEARSSGSASRHRD